MAAIVAYGQFVIAAVFFFALARLAYVLSANPIGELTQELIYLRVNDLRAPSFFTFAALLLEAVEMLHPLLLRQGLFRSFADFPFYLNALQSLFLLAASLLVLVVLQRYTHRGLDRRIRESMETLAYLAGQRRRRARSQSGSEEMRSEYASPPPPKRRELD